ncbi:MAG: hypothetical protein ACI9E5_001053 [Candidatus Omnitrophota bacterium]|jgi:hypothetical protein
MKIKYLFYSIVILALICTADAQADSSKYDLKTVMKAHIHSMIEELLEPSAPSKVSRRSEEYGFCSYDKLHIGFRCHLDWLYAQDKNNFRAVISQDPEVTFSIISVDSGVKFLSQLSAKRLDSFDLYAEGFAIERATMADQKTIKVKAFSKQNANVRLTDYYFVNDNKLYGVLFSVTPKSRWDEVQHLIDYIAKSISFDAYRPAK